VSPAIYAANLTALCFCINVIWIGGILPHPESVAAIHVFPPRIGHTARIRGVAYPRAVVLQSTVNVIRNIAVDAHVIELRNRQVHLVLPASSTIEAAP